jgi:hypothetical protein
LTLVIVLINILSFQPKIIEAFENGREQKMTPATLERKGTETPEEAKAKSNAEYMAMIERSLRQHERGEVFVTTIEALEAMTNER